MFHVAAQRARGRSPARRPPPCLSRLLAAQAPPPAGPPGTRAPRRRGRTAPARCGTPAAAAGAWTCPPTRACPAWPPAPGPGKGGRGPGGGGGGAGGLCCVVLWSRRGERGPGADARSSPGQPARLPLLGCSTADPAQPRTCWPSSDASSALRRPMTGTGKALQNADLRGGAGGAEGWHAHQAARGVARPARTHQRPARAPTCGAGSAAPAPGSRRGGARSRAGTASPAVGGVARAVGEPGQAQQAAPRWAAAGGSQQPA